MNILLQSVVNILVKHCGPRFFSLQLPGFSLLTLDFLQAIDSIISSNEVRSVRFTIMHYKIFLNSLIWKSNLCIIN